MSLPGRSSYVAQPDARSLADVLAEGLRDQGMAVDTARDGLEAAAKVDVNAYDVVVLDRDRPGIHGDTPLPDDHRARRTGHGADAHRGRLTK
jgi:DNA-binding response OmpR family regulator